MLSNLFCNSYNLQNLSEDYIRKNKDQLDWFWVCYNNDLTESFIEEMKDYIDWDVISETQYLSQSFMIKYKDSLNWRYLSEYQKFDEEFIVLMKDYVDFERIYFYQNQIDFCKIETYIDNKFLKILKNFERRDLNVMCTL